MMAAIFIKGPGAISLDYLLIKWLEKGDKNASDS